MAILKAHNFELEFSYHDLNDYNEIVYAFDVKFLGQQFLNPEIINDRYKGNVNGFDKFLISDCINDVDWLAAFFLKIKETRKGIKISTIEPPEIGFEAITWEDKRKEREKNWTGKTVKVRIENGDIVAKPYSEVGKFWEPLFEDNIDLIIDFPYEYFIGDSFNKFNLTVRTNFDELTSLGEDLNEEMIFFH